MSQQKIFVTGGAGFIGSWIVQKLLNDGHTVTVYDNFSSGLKENLTPVISDIELIEADILDYRTLEKAMAGHDLVFHEAAQLEITTAIDDPLIDVEQNIHGSLNTIRASQHNGIQKMIIASSGCVYGQVANPPVRETDETRPNWEYGVSKLAVEQYCDIFADYDDMQIANLRYGIVYGENEWYGRVLTIFLKRALEGKPLVIFGDGLTERDFVHVEDVAQLNHLLVTTEWEGNQRLNVATGTATTIVDLAALVAEVVQEVDGKMVEVMHEEIAEGESSKHVEGRTRLPRELGVMHLNSDKAQQLTGWKPTVALRDGIRRQYIWLKENHARWHTLSY